jgi:sigma-B regulation protein RsbU (phosphoserine phosphatase)
LLLHEKVALSPRLTTGGLLLGVVADATYDEGETILPPGSVLALYSDGVTEAADRQGRPFRDERLVATLGRLHSLSAGRILTGVVADVEEFAGRRPLADDLSVVVVRRRPTGEE